MDETRKQLVSDLLKPQPPRPGQARRVDHHYGRNGVADLFIAVEPLTGKRHVKITDDHTGRQWALFMKDLVDRHYPDAEQIILVLDNLNTHKKASLYETFTAEEAKRIADKLEIHYTPKHGSWLNMAEIHLSLLSRQCLDRRIPDRATLKKEITHWMNDHRSKPIDWRFTTEDARIKLKTLYPSFQE